MRKTLLMPLLLMLMLSAPGGALAATASTGAALQKLLTGYGKTHAINPCKHSAASLKAALAQMTPALTKAQPLFYAALQTAVSTREAGLQNCTAAATKGAATAPTTGTTLPGAATSPAAVAAPPSVTAAPVSPPAQPTTTLIPQPAPTVQTTTQHKISVPALIVAGLLIALALLGLLWTAATSGGRAPRGLEDSRHAMAEAAFRMRQAFAEFGDWMRLGR